MQRNIELKARCHDLEGVRRQALAIGAVESGILKQTDTYFRSPAGRLKLREIEGHQSELIFYCRTDDTSARASNYIISPIADPTTMIELLTAAFGCRGLVRKTRRLLLWKNVRIHLDEVEKLGSFLEFEAVVSEEFDEQASSANLGHLREHLRVRDEDIVPVSYCDLLGI